MTAVGAINPAITASAKISPKRIGAGLGLGALLTAGFCAIDFLKVPEAFKLKQNRKAEKVEGLNWGSGMREIGKSGLKCLQGMVVPAAILGLTATAGLVGALIGGVAAIVLPIFGYNFLDKKLPHEKEVVENACKKKHVEFLG